MSIFLGNDLDTILLPEYISLSFKDLQRDVFLILLQIEAE